MEEFKQSTILFQRNFLNAERVSEFLFCSICNEIFNNPMRLDCSHTFCYNCLKTLRKNSNKCPICNKKIIDSLISRDLLAFNIINDLEVFCNNENFGCPWKGKLSDIQNHLKVCNKNINLLIESNEKKNENIENKNNNNIENNNNNNINEKNINENNNIENNNNNIENNNKNINDNDNDNNNNKIIKILPKINKTSKKLENNKEKLDKFSKSILSERNKETLLTENSKNLIINFSQQIEKNKHFETKKNNENKNNLNPI
jgi:hypothetical protein